MSAKAKAAGVSASSFWDLKSEIAKRESSLAAIKATGKSATASGSMDRPTKKKTTRWERPNKGVSQRAARDSVEWARLGATESDFAQAALLRKTKIYDKLRKGQTGGLTEEQYDQLLVTFDTKQSVDTYESDSDDVDESLTVPTAPEDDPIVEYEDEYGRIRTAKRSEVPREYAYKGESSLTEDDPYIIRGPMNHIPTYEPSDERKAAIIEAASEANNPLATHYDPTREVRTRGAASYRFSADEEERTRQLNEFKSLREETQRIRAETGAVDIAVGVEPDLGGSGNDNASLSRSRAAEKRKREIEERRRAIEQKRRKTQMSTITEPAEPATGASSVVLQESPGAQAAASTVAMSRILPATPADDFLASLERDMLSRKNK